MWRSQGAGVIHISLNNNNNNNNELYLHDHTSTCSFAKAIFKNQNYITEQLRYFDNNLSRTSKQAKIYFMDREMCIPRFFLPLLKEVSSYHLTEIVTQLGLRQESYNMKRWNIVTLAGGRGEYTYHSTTTTTTSFICMTIQAHAVLQKLFLRIKITSQGNYVTLIITWHEHQNKLKYILCTEIMCIPCFFFSCYKKYCRFFLYLTQLETQLRLYWRDTHITRNICTGIHISLVTVTPDRRIPIHHLNVDVLFVHHSEIR